MPSAGFKPQVLHSEASSSSGFIEMAISPMSDEMAPV
jgi:hypothetical protein